MLMLTQESTKQVKAILVPLLPIFPNHGPTKKRRQSRQMGEEEERELGDNKEKKTAVSIP